MSKTKIDWANYTWNPVTGCYHDCPYCYARKIARRFGNKADLRSITEYKEITHKGYKIFIQYENIHDNKNKITPYPFGFKPTFNKNRLTYPSEIKKPSNIFVGSMADMFGEWIPDDWIEEIFDACDKYPQHNYLFLTKNPVRYSELMQKDMLPKKDNMWYGTTITKQNDKYFKMEGYNTFISFEPLMERIHNSLDINNEGMADWIIIGAETGNRKDRVKVTQDMVIQTMVYAIHYDSDPHLETPVFMKNSLVDIVEPKYFT